MTREEAIRFGNCILKVADEDTDSDAIEFTKMAIKALEQNESAEEWYKLFVEKLEQEPKWIPVSERLPDNTDDVLVYDNSDIFVAWYSGIHGDWFSADNRFNEYAPIIAWQPLPEPYEPQESEVSDADSD